jgi:hypothetical protein
LECSAVLEIPDTLTISGCSECLDDGGCTDGDLCTPIYDVAAFKGYRSCQAPGSAAIDEGCDFDGSGDQQCASGICAFAEIQGVGGGAGVCGSCVDNNDCVDPEVCLPGVIGIDGTITGAHCGEAP